MKFVMTPYCDICGHPRGNTFDHSACSRKRKQMGGTNRTNGKKRLGEHEIRYLEKTGSK